MPVLHLKNFRIVFLVVLSLCDNDVKLERMEDIHKSLSFVDTTIDKTVKRVPSDSGLNISEMLLLTVF